MSDRPVPDPDRPDPDELTRSDMRTLRGALRNDWPIPDDVKQRLLQSLVNMADPETLEGARTTARGRMSAIKTILQMARLTLAQQALDLNRERAESARGDASTVLDAMKEVERIERALEPGP